ncbi:YSC84-related protein [Marinagarivorans cellulosilyticus]|uniref:Ysc84 actin-binding domain-containing protein n=1 Tax=Marinagarivorans cellulosilyticus TaxID=2721545 RepID=A0AAN1WFW7_9GAMM|nr:YSC84-related protein [Marinagarivorans cellulosilyticus]BCD96852.1 hypothetical protein MARGE09_P1052 [Marinagarivorans cellulosilyticus]
MNTFKKQWTIKLLAGLALISFFSGCATTKVDTVAEKRQVVLKMRNETLARLYKEKPNTKAQIASSPGYAVFSNANVNVILASFGGGYGVVDNQGKKTYMKMGEVGIGIGAGVKDFRIVMVFDTQKALDNFVAHGWVFGAQTDAAAKASDKGAALGAEAVANGITVYQLTETGLALQATIKGTKFWRDDELN